MIFDIEEWQSLVQQHDTPLFEASIETNSNELLIIISDINIFGLQVMFSFVFQQCMKGSLQCINLELATQFEVVSMFLEY